MLPTGVRPFCLRAGSFTPLLLILWLSGCGLLRRPAVAVDRSQDPRIRGEVMNRLAAEPALGGREFRVDVEGAVVTLYGSVTGIDSWNCAIRNAQLVEGVRTVVEFLMIESGPSPVPCSLGSAR